MGGTSGESTIANHFSAIANSVGSTDSRDQVMNALGTVPSHNDVINVHELRQIARGLKNKKAVGNYGILSKVCKFASERLLAMMQDLSSPCNFFASSSSSIFLSGSMFMASYRVPLCT